MDSTFWNSKPKRKTMAISPVTKNIVKSEFNKATGGTISRTVAPKLNSAKPSRINRARSFKKGNI